MNKQHYQEIYTDYENAENKRNSQLLTPINLTTQMLEIIQMVDRTPNDTDLGRLIRKFINLYHNE